MLCPKSGRPVVMTKTADERLKLARSLNSAKSAGRAGTGDVAAASVPALEPSPLHRNSSIDVQFIDN